MKYLRSSKSTSNWARRKPKEFIRILPSSRIPLRNSWSILRASCPVCRRQRSMPASSPRRSMRSFFSTPSEKTSRSMKKRSGKSKCRASPPPRADSGSSLRRPERALKHVPAEIFILDNPAQPLSDHLSCNHHRRTHVLVGCFKQVFFQKRRHDRVQSPRADVFDLLVHFARNPCDLPDPVL